MEGKQHSSTLSAIDGETAPNSSVEHATPGTVTAAQRGHRARRSDRDAVTPAAVTTTPAQSVGFTLSSLGHAVARRFKSTLDPLHLEPREFALLRAVAPAEGASQQAIGERLQIPASRMVAFVDALEARGLLERRPNPDDRRARALYLTDDGRELLAGAFRLAGELERHLCAQLSDAEREQLLDALQRVGAQLGVSPGTHAAHLDGTH